MSEAAAAVASLDQVVTAAISIGAILVSIISVMAVWLRKTLLIIFNKTIDDLKKDIVNCQEKINIRIDDVDKYGQKNREISYKAKDGIAEHVEKFHTK